MDANQKYISYISSLVVSTSSPSWVAALRTAYKRHLNSTEDFLAATHTAFILTIHSIAHSKLLVKPFLEITYFLLPLVWSFRCAWKVVWHFWHNTIRSLGFSFPKRSYVRWCTCKLVGELHNWQRYPARSNASLRLPRHVEDRKYSW